MTPENIMRTEGNKLLLETLKQMVTISSGSILVMAVFLEKVLPQPPQWVPIIATSFVSLFICIIAGITMMYTISLNVGAGYSRDFQPVERIVYKFARWSFLLAIGAFVVFVIKNLLFR